MLPPRSPVSDDRASAPDLLLQQQDAVDQGLGGRRAARDVDVDRHDPVAAAHDRVAEVVVAAAVGAGAHRQHVARLGHLVVDLAERRRHLVAQGAGHDHHVRLARAGAEHQAEPVEVVARGGACIISTAQQARPKVIGHSEPDRAQLTRSFSVVTKKPCFSRPALTLSNRLTAGAWPPARPGRRRGHSHSKAPFAPLVDEPDREHAQEHDHRPEPEQADVAEADRPREQERHLEVEDDEQDRHQVEAHVEPAAGVLERLEAALVGRQLLPVGLLRGTDQEATMMIAASADRDRQEDQDRQVLGQVGLHRGPANVGGRARGQARRRACRKIGAAAQKPRRRACVLSPRLNLTASGFRAVDGEDDGT